MELDRKFSLAYTTGFLSCALLVGATGAGWYLVPKPEPVIQTVKVPIEDKTSELFANLAQKCFEAKRDLYVDYFNADSRDGHIACVRSGTGSKREWQITGAVGGK